MRKRDILKIALSIAIPTLLVTLLNLSITRPNDQKNGFKRAFLNVHPDKVSLLPSKTEIIAICGITDSLIFYQIDNPLKLLVSDHNLSHFNEWHLNIPSRQINRNFKIVVNFPNANLFAFSYPAIIQYDMVKKEAKIHERILGFTRAMPISKQAYVIRCPDESRTDRIFKKVAFGDSTIEMYEKNITEQLHDGGFSTDGLLYYDSARQQLIYTY